MSIFDQGWPPNPAPAWYLEPDPEKRVELRREAEKIVDEQRAQYRKKRIEKAAKAIRDGDPNWAWIVGNPHEWGPEHAAAIALAMKE